MSRIYFSSTHFKLAILSEKKFYERLPSLFAPASADLGYITLCLCMHLIQQTPSPSSGTMLSPLYALAKTGINQLEMLGYFPIETIQSMLLIVLYEVGHGIYPAASISMASCARAARNLGLHKIRSKPLTESENENGDKRRAWWAIHNLDRYV
jgi:hypothetical protein